MYLSEIFDYLSYGELSQYEIGTGNSGVISEVDFPRVTSLVNRALIQLHTKLPLRLEQVLVETNQEDPRYVLNSRFAVSNTTSTEAMRYIKDAAYPFKDNIIKIEQVFTSDEVELFLNDSTDPDTIYTPTKNTIQFANPFDGLVAVFFRANHPTLSMSRGIDPTVVEVDISDSLLEPLITFISSRVVLSKGGNDGLQASMALTNSFNTQIADLESQGVFSVDFPKQERIWSNKWV